MNIARLRELLLSGDPKAARHLYRLLGEFGRALGRRSAGSGFAAVRLIAKGRGTAAQISLQWRWSTTVHVMFQKIRFYHSSRWLDPWERKIRAMIICVRLRAKDTVQRFEGQRGVGAWQYSTSTWDEAIERMLQAANRHCWRGRLDQWVRWSMTAAKNFNRRKNRYAGRENGHSEGFRIEGDAEGAGLQMCLFGA